MHVAIMTVPGAYFAHPVLVSRCCRLAQRLFDYRINEHAFDFRLLGSQFDEALVGRLPGTRVKLLAIGRDNADHRKLVRVCPSERL
jgi:hypothetical protein